MTSSHTSSPRFETASFGAGCFWGVEAEFRALPGVLDVTAGYLGGRMPNPTYHDVCSGQTGHAEGVQIQYDPTRISYEALLETFWAIHDPTTMNRQGPDVGSQYRSAVFYHSEAQRVAAEASKSRQEAGRRFARPIVTEIVEAGTFYPAEDYHQRYFEKQGRVCKSKNT
ncbi:MAG TPA: peptide-methionine (S)-S-oxide reductase MsrA [Candidatus Baltobacteraceae bacterium]|jgi:peptide-methionine (S)-S-oxide reductase|nr:peptide-methionine (S)-S-oxide reductase MsrA [Candidatus Baltobacteraceae bacterium]